MACTREYTHTFTHTCTSTHSTCAHTHTQTRKYTLNMHKYCYLKRINFCFVGPPSAPQNVVVSNVTNTSVFIMWEASANNGNRMDLFYSISHNVTGDIFTANSTNITLTELIPFVSYELDITAKNGVSSQDDDNIDMRTVTISIMTEGGGICACVCVPHALCMCVRVCMCACVRVCLMCTCV